MTSVAFTGNWSRLGFVTVYRWQAGTERTPGRLNKGKHFDRKAARMLRKQGLEILERNYRCRAGEIDLVCSDGETIVFVEVRFRGNRGFASALESVDGAKQGRLIKAAQHYLLSRGIRDSLPCRIDVVAFDASADGGKDDIQWLQNAVTHREH